MLYFTQLSLLSKSNRNLESHTFKILDHCPTSLHFRHILVSAALPSSETRPSAPPPYFHQTFLPIDPLYSPSFPRLDLFILHSSAQSPSTFLSSIHCTICLKLPTLDPLPTFLNLLIYDPRRYKSLSECNLTALQSRLWTSWNELNHLVVSSVSNCMLILRHSMPTRWASIVSVDLMNMQRTAVGKLRLWNLNW